MRLITRTDDILWQTANAKDRQSLFDTDGPGLNAEVALLNFIACDYR